MAIIADLEPRDVLTQLLEDGTITGTNSVLLLCCIFCSFCSSSHFIKTGVPCRKTPSIH